MPPLGTSGAAFCLLLRVRVCTDTLSHRSNLGASPLVSGSPSLTSLPSCPIAVSSVVAASVDVVFALVFPLPCMEGGQLTTHLTAKTYGSPRWEQRLVMLQQIVTGLGCGQGLQRQAKAVGIGCGPPGPLSWQDMPPNWQPLHRLVGHAVVRGYGCRACSNDGLHPPLHAPAWW